MGEQGLLTPAAPLVLLECKASSTTAEIRVQEIDTEVFTTVSTFGTEVHGWEEDGVSLCSLRAVFHSLATQPSQEPGAEAQGDGVVCEASCRTSVRT